MFFFFLVHKKGNGMNGDLPRTARLCIDDRCEYTRDSAYFPIEAKKRWSTALSLGDTLYRRCGPRGVVEGVESIAETSWGRIKSRTI